VISAKIQPRKFVVLEELVESHQSFNFVMLKYRGMSVEGPKVEGRFKRAGLFFVPQGWQRASAASSNGTVRPKIVEASHKNLFPLAVG